MNRVLVPLAVQPAPPPLGAMVHALAGRTMGTTWSVRLLGPTHTDLPTWQAILQQALDALVAQMSTWDGASTLSRFNHAPAGSWQVLPGELHTVLACALNVARASDGAFDPTAGPLVDLWGFGPHGRHDEVGFQPPSEAACEAARTRCGWQRVVLDDGRALQPGGVQLDLSAIAKGYAVDHLTCLLRDAGIEGCLVEVGGELRGHGVKPGGMPWWVALEQPPGGRFLPLLLAAHDMSVATSGDYRRCYRDAQGRLRPHTIDPRTGWPVEHAVASVTVVHADCMLADAWSTALTVLGADEGLTLAEARGLAVHLVQRDTHGQLHERMSSAMQAMLQ